MRTLSQVINELKEYDGEPIKIMEVCGTHTASIFKNGIRSLISPKIQLISGPGCPVCVTSPAYIDKLIEYSLKENYQVLTFGDMMKVKGSEYSLTSAKALGANVKILYSPLAAITEAMEHKDMEFIFAAVGFETTTPIYALLIEEMAKNNVKNLRILTSLKTIVPALTYICENEKNIDAFLCPGHVSVITGARIYEDLVSKYQKPCVVSGFEGEHILAAIYEIVRQIETKEYKVKNMYINAVSEEGNQKALDIIQEYFEITDDHWRGIGKIEGSALKLKEEFSEFDAGSNVDAKDEKVPKECRCTDVILGRIHPIDCLLFSKACNPLNAIGPCMVSTEGACGIWYKNRRLYNEN